MCNSGARKVQVCFGLQDQGTEEADRAKRERGQRKERTDTGSKLATNGHDGQDCSLW